MKSIFSQKNAINIEWLIIDGSDEETQKNKKILITGVNGFIGLSLANYTKNFIPNYLYVGSYLALAVLTIIPAVFLSFYKEQNDKDRFT